MSRDSTACVQRFYPQIYLACHVDHVRATSTAYRLSTPDSTLLVHLDSRRMTRAGTLARHLGVAASTLSASIKRLESLRYIVRAAFPRDRRAVGLRLTPLGAEAIEATSVLDSRHVTGLLSCLSPSQRKRAVAGLALLARAATLYRKKHPSRRSPSP